MSDNGSWFPPANYNGGKRGSVEGKTGKDKALRQKIRENRFRYYEEVREMERWAAAGCSSAPGWRRI